MNANSYKFLLAEDHSIVRKGTKLLLAQYFDNISFFETDNLHSLIHELKKKDQYDLAILDVFLADGNTITALQTLQNIAPGIPLLYFTMCSEELYGQRLISMGIDGFVNKRSPEMELIEAVRTILNHQKFISKSLASEIAMSLSNDAKTPFEKLSNREFEVMILMLEGKSLKEISAKLDVQPTTIGTFKNRIFDKLRVASLIELNKLSATYHLF